MWWCQIWPDSLMGNNPPYAPMLWQRCYNVGANVVGMLPPTIVTTLISRHFSTFQQRFSRYPDNSVRALPQHPRLEITWKFKLDILSRHKCIFNVYFYSNTFTSRNIFVYHHIPCQLKWRGVDEFSRTCTSSSISTQLSWNDHSSTFRY